MPWNFNAGSPMLNSNDNFELRIHIVDADVTKIVPLDPEATIFQLCETIRKNIREAQTKSPKSYGLFLPHDDLKKGLWLDNSKTLQHYILKRGDTLEYRNRSRWLHIRTMDGTNKTLKVDDSWTVSELMLTVCTKLGIYNYDEYSLISDKTDFSPGIDKTLSMKRGISINKDQEKLDKLKKKYHTEDGLNWLNPSQSLRQQGIEEKEVLLLKRKYFFSDMNVDSRDPIQLSLLYEQLKDAVINGTHPVTQSEAIELAGLQCQVQLGNYSADKFKPGFLDLRECLPKEYQKNPKTVEKKIFNQHSKSKDLSEVEAKEKYCLFCRSLKTYGITFFLVKEKVIGKNKLIPRLLGVNKESVVQVDEKTKEIINTWPLTSIRKWAASFNGFTMDFGEYSPDEYYTAQTDKGERISQLIAGYIDIILKRKKAKDHLGVDADEESIMYEENIAPSKAIIVEHVPKQKRSSASQEDVVIRKKAHMANAAVRMNSQASDSICSQDPTDFYQEDINMSRQTSSLGRTQSPSSSLTTNSMHYRMSDDDIRQKLYIISLQDNLDTIQKYKDQLMLENKGPEIGKDEASQKWIYINIDNSRQRMADEIGAMNAAVAQVLRSAQGLATIEESEEEEMNEEMIAKMQNSFSLITVHLPSLMEEIRTAAYYQDQLTDEDVSGEELIAAAKRLADAFTNLIKAAYPVEDQKRSLNRKEILDAANAVGEASSDLLQQITEQENSQMELKSDRPYSIIMITEEEQLFQEELLRLAKCVANETTNLIKQVKVIAVEADNPSDQKKVVMAATETGLAISQLISTTKIVAPTIEQSVCQEQLIFSIEDVSKAIQVVVESSNKATQSEELQSLTIQAADQVQEALDTLMKHLRKDFDKNDKLDNFLLAYENIQEVDDSDEDPDKLVSAARRLAQATTAMISEIQMKAVNEDYKTPEERDRLINAAKQLAEATTVLIDSAKNCTMDKDEINLRYTLREATERFIVVTYTTECANYIQEQVIDHLLVAARKAATTGTHLINTSLSAAKKSRASNFKVCNDGKELSNQISKLIVAIKEARRDPKDHLAQLELIAACRDYIDPSEQLSQSNKYMWPTVSDPSLQTALNQSIKQSVIATEELKKCVHQADLMCQHLDLSAALEQLNKLEQNLKNIKNSIERENLIPLPDEKRLLKTSLASACPTPDWSSDRRKKSDESAALLIKSVRRSGSAANQFKNDLESRCVVYDQTNGEDSYQNLENLDAAGLKARELSMALERLVHAARGVAASIEFENQEFGNNDRDLEKLAQFQIVNNCLEAVKAAHDLVKEAKSSPPDNYQMDRAQQASVRLSDALLLCLDSLPGQRDLDMLSKHIETKKHQFAENQIPIQEDNNINLSNCRSELTDTTFDFNQAVSELVSAPSFNLVNKGCKKMRMSYDRIVDICNVLVHDSFDESDSALHHVSSNKDQITNGVMTMSEDCQTLLDRVKKIQCEPDNIVVRKQLQEATKMLLDSINRLLTNISTNLRPGQKECDKTIYRLESMRPILDNPVHPISHKDYFECLDFIIDKTVQPLADSLKNIPVAVKDENNQKFIDSIYQCADSVCILLEETAQAAYLVGIGDVRSKIGKKGLADHSSFQHIQKEITENCQTICNPDTTARQMISTAGQIAENSRKLCEASKTIMTSFPNDKIKLSDKTKITLLAVSELMTGVQNLNQGFNEENRKDVEYMSSKVQDNVAELVQLLLSYKFAGDAAIISEEARESQGPIKAAGITVLDTAIEIIQCSKALISSDSNEELFVAYSSSCKDLNDALKHLISTIKESAPGQKECDEALVIIAKLIKQSYDAKMKIMKNRPRASSRTYESEESYQNILQSALIQMPRCINELSRAGKKEPEQLARGFSRQTQLLESMVNSCICAANQTDLLQNSNIYLEHLITILEASEQLLKAIKKSGGNPKATSVHSQIDEMGQGVIESCEDLLAALDKISFKQGNVNTIVETITKSSAKVQESAIIPEKSRFGNSQSRMLDICYDMDNLTTDISSNANSESTQRLLAPLTQNLTQRYDDLCRACQSAVATLSNENNGKQLQECVQTVGKVSISLVKSTSDVRPAAASSISNLQTKAKELHKRIDDVIQLLISSNVGTQACTQAIKILKEINRDIETSILFVKSMDIQNDDGEYYSVKELFKKSRNSVIENSTELVRNIKLIVSKDVCDVNILQESANQIALTSKNLANDVKVGLEHLNSSTSQYNIELLTSFQEVILSLITFLEVARNTSGLPYTDPIFQQLKEEGKRSINAVTSLLKVLKSMDDLNLKDFQAIDNAIIDLENNHETLLDLENSLSREASPVESTASTNRLSLGSDITVSPRFASEEINRMISPLANICDKILEISSPEFKSIVRQENILVVSMSCSKINSELTSACKNLLRNGPVTDLKKETLNTVDQIVNNYVTLLKNFKMYLTNPSKETRIPIETAASKLNELIKLLRDEVNLLREGPRLVMYFRPSSPEWRDVSEKYIGRHVAYHHCFVKSYNHDSHTSLHHHQAPFIQLPINARDPSEVDVDNAKNQIKFVTTKLIEIKLNPDLTCSFCEPNIVVNEIGNGRTKYCINNDHKPFKIDVHPNQLIGKDKCSVAEVDQMLSYIKDIGSSAENLLSSSQEICKSNADADSEIWNMDFKKEIFKSAIGVANAMKDLCEAASKSLSTGCSPVWGDRMSTSTKKVANSTGQLLLNLKPTVVQNKSQIEKIHTHGNQIKKNTDLLLNHLNCINNRKWGDDSLNNNMMFAMNEKINCQAEILAKQKELDDLKIQLNLFKIEQIKQNPHLYDEDNKTNAL